MRLLAVACPVLVGLVLAVSLQQPVHAQYGGGQYGSHTPDLLAEPWENNLMRVSRISIDPGQAVAAVDAAGRIIVYLTADPEGGLPASEAVWEDAGTASRENRGALRVEAIAIDLKDVEAAAAAGTPPEALPTFAGEEVRTLIDNDRVLVTKHRYAPNTSVDPIHFHPEDVLVVYLRGGYVWPTDGRWGASRVRRGEIDVVPANTLHTFGNAGPDPIEFLMISPR